MIKELTKIFGALLLFIMMAGSTLAQGIERDKMDPQATEIWEPEPAVVALKNGVPSDAIVLFDGSNLDAWESWDKKDAQWIVSNGVMTVKAGTGSIQTRDSFSDMQLHIEWASPAKIEGEGQGRGNSGVFIMGKYEVQILDSYNNRTYSNGQASSVYKQSMPLVNATMPPGKWNTYDIIFRAPRFNENGIQVIPATVTVLHNGVLTQDHTVIWGPIQYKGLPVIEAHGPSPLSLQDHGNPVQFRNIWIRKI